MTTSGFYALDLVPRTRTIDTYFIDHYHLQTMGNGQLFLPVKAAIRKQLHKQAGDQIRLVLYRATGPVRIPDELLSCLEDAPDSLQRFRLLSQGQQRAAVAHIEEAKNPVVRANRIGALLNRLLTTANENA